MTASRLLASLLSPLAACVLMAACSSTPPDEPAAQTSEALLVCPDVGCPTVCYDYDDSSCSTEPATWETVDGPFLGFGGPNRSEQAILKSEMIAEGCSLLFLYSPCTNGELSGGRTCLTSLHQPMAECPIANLTADVAAFEMAGCDQCTGQPTAGHVFLTWMTFGGLPGGCHSPAACNRQ